MKYSFAVKYNGEFYPPNTEIPEESTEESTEEISETEEKPKTTRKRKQ